MSQENVELIQRGWEAYEGGDLYGAIAVLSPEMVTYVAPPIPVAGTYRGPEGFLQVTTDIGYVAEEIRAAGDQVATVALVSGTGRFSGAPFERRTGQLFTLRNGRVVRWEAFDDTADAFQAAGLAE